MMTRSWMLYASPFAFAAGMTLVHCSSSSSTATVDSGKTDSGKGTGTGSSSGSGSHKHDAGSSGSGSSSGSGTGVKDAGKDAPAFNAQAGDQPDACSIPDGGTTCTPGSFKCAPGDAGPCAVPANQCCELGGTTPNACQPFTGADASTCSGNIVQCEEAADCPTPGDICCLDVTSAAPTSLVSCQPGPSCPSTSQLAYAQICRSNNECASGKCVIYSCLDNTETIQACQGTVNGALASTCTPTP